MNDLKHKPVVMEAMLTNAERFFKRLAKVIHTDVQFSRGSRKKHKRALYVTVGDVEYKVKIEVIDTKERLKKVKL